MPSQQGETTSRRGPTPEGSGMGDEGCFKSVLPPQVLDDSRLALPAEHSLLSPARFHSVDRSVRVQQQVQLTLARKGKRSASNVVSRPLKKQAIRILPPRSEAAPITRPTAGGLLPLTGDTHRRGGLLLTGDFISAACNSGRGAPRLPPSPGHACAGSL
ncbi:unnamed protein product [Gadus morhua 'NCC']